MKINGRAPLPTPSTVVPFPRWDQGKEIVLAIRLTAVSDYTEFNKLVDEPKPKFKHIPGQDPVPFTEDPTYQQARQDYISLQTTWGFMQALRENNIEWDKVKPGDPTTWKHLEEELREWLLVTEMMTLTNEWIKLSGLDLDRVRVLRDRFLSGTIQELQSLPSSQKDELSTTPSGELANDSEPGHQE